MDVEKRIEQFFEASLSIEEEQELCRYLLDNDVPPHLQRDKEAVLLLCAEASDCALPQGAAARLEAFLDNLENERLLADTIEVLPAKPVVRSKRISILRRVAAVAAAAAVALFLIVKSVTVADCGDEQVMRESDTFSTPEEARECARRAFGDILLAMSSARENTQEIGYTLEQSARAIKTTIKK